jgi:hypothetical protein
MVIDPGPSDNFLDFLDVSENLRRLIRRTATEFEHNLTWVSFDALAYEAADTDASFDLNEVFGMPSVLGGVWSGEELSLTALGLFEARTAPITCETMLELVRICVDRKKRIRESASIGSEVLLNEYGWSLEVVKRCRSLVRLIPGLIGGGNEDGDDWSFQIFRGALLEYRLVESTDDIWAILQNGARDTSALHEQGRQPLQLLGPLSAISTPNPYGAATSNHSDISDDSSEVGPWRPDHIRVFLSHIHEHCGFAADVCDSLRELAVDAFVAHIVIEPSQAWQDEIERALTTADVLVGLLHPGFTKSIWTQQEVGWALGRGIPTLMVRLGEDPTGFSGRFQASPGDASSPRITASRILVWLSSLAPFGSDLTQRLVASLRNANSYASAKEAAQRLDEIGHLTPAIIGAITEAYVENDQIAGHVAEPIIGRMLQRHGRQLPERASP